MTVVESILQLVRLGHVIGDDRREVRVLVCAPSNSAADIIAAVAGQRACGGARSAQAPQPRRRRTAEVLVCVPPGSVLRDDGQLDAPIIAVTSMDAL